MINMHFHLIFKLLKLGTCSYFKYLSSQNFFYKLSIYELTGRGGHLQLKVEFAVSGSKLQVKILEPQTAHKNGTASWTTSLWATPQNCKPNCPALQNYLLAPSFLTLSILTAKWFFVLVWKFEASCSSLNTWERNICKILILIYHKNHQHIS